ncbi:MAG: cytochrome c class I [Chitinophagaceae bacterium]|nr:cytochrome c class I [Chitinophagaceae bacterium]
MKSFVWFVLVSLVMISCGNGKNNAEKSNNTENVPATEDITWKPEYQEGLAIVSKPENLCLPCHKIDEKLTGPSYRDVANKYENTEENVAMLAKKVKQGGVGVWGDVPMPANATITEEEAKKAVRYILLLRNK